MKMLPARTERADQSPSRWPLRAGLLAVAALAVAAPMVAAEPAAAPEQIRVAAPEPASAVSETVRPGDAFTGLGDVTTVVGAATALHGAGLPCPVVSVGSTPTAHAARDLTGVTEMRAGVYVFFDLVMAGIEACSIDDIALSVLTTVIGHQTSRDWTICDAGWMTMSRDRGTANQRVDQGYGIVCDEAGQVIPGLIVKQANQEHGVVARHPDYTGPIPDMPVGTKRRILPNHACATAAQHAQYHVIPEEAGAPLMEWPRFGGW